MNSGSLALRADGIRSLVDVFGSAAVLFGLILSAPKTGAFPYGLYKVENVVSIIIAFLLVFASYELSREAFVSGEREVITTPWLLAVVAVLVAGFGPLRTHGSDRGALCRAPG